jgi:hypothetical protein
MVIKQLTLEFSHYSVKVRHLLPTFKGQEKLLKLKNIGNVVTVPKL